MVDCCAVDLSVVTLGTVYDSLRLVRKTGTMESNRVGGRPGFGSALKHRNVLGLVDMKSN